MSELLPADVEGALRTYLRADSGVAALFGTRVFFGVDSPSAYPVCTIQRIGGGTAGGTAEGLAEVALVQIDVWGDRHDKATAFNGMAAVVAALNALARYTGHSGVLLHGANVQSTAFLADESERARYTAAVQVFVSPL